MKSERIRWRWQFGSGGFIARGDGWSATITQINDLQPRVKGAPAAWRWEACIDVGVRVKWRYPSEYGVGMSLSSCKRWVRQTLVANGYLDSQQSAQVADVEGGPPMQVPTADKLSYMRAYLSSPTVDDNPIDMLRDAVNMLRAIEALHQPQEGLDEHLRPEPWCPACANPWPCETHRLLHPEWGPS